MLAGAAGALTAALGAVSAALPTEEAELEEWDGGEWDEVGLGMPDKTKEVVVDVRARCTARDCRHALRIDMKAPLRSTFRPNCHSADAAITRMGIYHCHHLVYTRAFSPPPAQANSIPAQTTSSLPHTGAKLPSEPQVLACRCPPGRRPVQSSYWLPRQAGGHLARAGGSERYPANVVPVEQPGRGACRRR